MGDPASESVGIPEADLDGDIGTPDVDVMADIRDLFRTEEPLMEGYDWNDPIHKRELHLRFSEGVAADWSRLDVTWYTSGAYKFHYTDGNEQNWRFDRHPNSHSEERHFHKPPDADSESAVASCITVVEPKLVARAILKLWRRAVVTGSFTELNSAQNPP